MNRFRQYGQLDDVPEPLGDAAFQRLDMQSDPATLGQGTVQVSENMRFGVEGARPREGIANRLAPGSAPDTILYCGIYRPDNDHDRLAFVTGSALLLFDPDTQTIDTYNYPGGETVTDGDPVDFIQGGVDSGTTPTAWILRGLNQTALKFDGATVTVDANFKKGLFALYYQNRMAVASGESASTESQSVSVSDFLDFTTWTLLNQFKILFGGDDYLTGFMAYQKDIVIVASRKRFFIAYFAPQYDANGYAYGLSETGSYLRNLTREAGLIGRHAWTEAGGLIFALSDRGIFAFQPQLDLELTVLGSPISAPIQPIMDRLTANDADGAYFQHLGERLYCALPVSDEPLGVNDIMVSAGNATAELAAAHGCAVGDMIQLRGANDSLLNGQFTVTAVVDATHLTFTTTAAAGALVGARAKLQRLVMRNNAIAVLNLSRPYTDPLNGRHYPGAWESIDWLPAGLYADSLHIADDGAQRRLFLVDRSRGAFAYEEGDVDETGAFTGGLRTGATLPAQLGGINRSSVPVAGRLKSRVLRWGPFPRHVKAGEVRLDVSDGGTGSVTFTVRTPDRPEWSATRTFDGTGETDTSARKRCGKRGLEADIEITTTSGRPAIRSLAIETVASGRVAEE